MKYGALKCITSKRKTEMKLKSKQTEVVKMTKPHINTIKTKILKLNLKT